MQNTNQTEDLEDGLRPEYDFRGGQCGVYAERYAEGTNLVKLDLDVAVVFATPEAVNAVLRALIQTMPKANRAEAAQQS